ncbi:diacylglycerol kinase [Sulfitobacter alexandrii]|uniref:Diacylglycerol kinase n=1 Tax=Sulfitobacter alexandrii TaxID=1917485 RepID=A0A1J0WGK5_9RHOB|nr:diacylglycerol kinase [Sulfitobacter alexandrii]APE43447.1 diacylglycerol kinase [Sulfitobacter alexandrii]
MTRPPFTSSPPVKPARVTGIAHVFAAAGYSLGGLRRLWQETAFRHIVLALLLGFGLLAFAGAEATDYAILLVLFFGLVAVEALNTAIECIVDHLSPDWAAFARDAKDLGSLATMCLLCANGVFLGAVMLRSFAG